LETGWASRLDPALARRSDAVSLDQARLRMLFYLDWVSADLAFRAPLRDVAHPIKLGADRLREIARATPGRSQRGVRTPTGTQKEIVRAAGVSRTTVSRIERGATVAGSNSRAAWSNQRAGLKARRPPLRRQPPIAFGVPPRHQVNAFPIGNPPHSGQGSRLPHARPVTRDAP
jgi:hypothetical protein